MTTKSIHERTIKQAWQKAGLRPRPVGFDDALKLLSLVGYHPSMAMLKRWIVQRKVIPEHRTRNGKPLFGKASLERMVALSKRGEKWRQAKLKKEPV